MTEEMRKLLEKLSDAPLFRPTPSLIDRYPQLEWESPDIVFGASDGHPDDHGNN